MINSSNTGTRRVADNRRRVKATGDHGAISDVSATGGNRSNQVTVPSKTTIVPVSAEGIGEWGPVNEIYHFQAQASKPTTAMMRNT